MKFCNKEKGETKSFLGCDGNYFLIFIMALTVVFLLVVAFSLYEIKEMLGIHLIEDEKKHKAVSINNENSANIVWDFFQDEGNNFKIHYPADWIMETNNEHLVVLKRIQTEEVGDYKTEAMLLRLSVDYLKKGKDENLNEFLMKNKKEGDQYDLIVPSEDEINVEGVAVNNSIPFELHCFDDGDATLCLRADYYRVGNTEKCHDMFKTIVSRVEMGKGK